MTRSKIALLSAAFAVAVASATPALALNPQPLPPGHSAPTHIACANGSHARR
ncbi:MAG TPA: hypothetical protein VHY10_10450 [Xanthobacteraceae bacterium]|jgi:hypothetical protein|nr:hypothetical protein [Xanthobacteraceae bacterium]